MASAVAATFAVCASAPLAVSAAPASPAVPRHAFASPAARPANGPAVKVKCDLKSKELSSAGHFRVFSCDSAGQKLVSAAAKELEALWPKMTVKEPDGMGPPEGWADGKGQPLHVYLVPPSTNACENATSCSNPWNVEDNLGEESPATVGKETVFVLLINEQTPSADFDAVLCHEFFHALEDTLAPDGPAGSWLGEASATWAETIYVRKSADAAGFLPSFQVQKSSLDSTAGTHEYGAFVWLLWLTQDIADDPTGDLGTSAVFKLWESLKGAKTTAEINAVINKSFPWATDFPRFALEDQYQPGFTPDVSPHSFNQAYTALPDSSPPLPLKKLTAESGTSEFPVDLPPLSSWSLNFKSIQPGVKDVYLDFSNVSSNADAYVMAKIDGKYQVFNDTGTDQEFCLDDPSQKVTEFTVMIVDHSPTDAVRNGTYELTGNPHCATPQPCQKLLHASDLPYDVLQATDVPGDEFGIDTDVCVFIGEDPASNPLVTGDLGIGMQSIAIAKQVMSDDQNRNPQLKSVKGVGDQALSGCASPSSCRLTITIARRKQNLVVVDTNTSTVDTIALAKLMISRIPK